MLSEALAGVSVEACYAEDMLLNTFALTADGTLNVAVCSNYVYVYKVGRGVMSKSSANIRMLEDYAKVKPLMLSRLNEFGAEEAVMDVFHAESLGCYQANFADILLSGNTDEEKLHQIFEDTERRDYIQAAKEYFRNKNNLSEELAFTSAAYTYEQYLQHSRDINEAKVSLLSYKLKLILKRLLYR